MPGYQRQHGDRAGQKALKVKNLKNIRYMKLISMETSFDDSVTALLLIILQTQDCSSTGKAAGPEVSVGTQGLSG